MVYLATVIDAHSYRGMGCSIAAHMSTDLIENALVMARKLRENRPAPAIFRNDRDIQ